MVHRLALVSMPFASSRRPSLQLGMLKGLASEVGWEVETFHFNLDFGALVGREVYELLCQHRGMQVSDWLFSPAAFGDAAPDPDGRLFDLLPVEFVDELGTHIDGDILSWIQRLRTVLVPAYLLATCKVLEASSFDLVGFSCTFQQNVASFALARLLKQRNPDLVTLFGGANFDDVMGLEYVRKIDAVDLAVIGEGDVSFPKLLEAILNEESLDKVPGLARMVGGSLHYTPTESPFNDLESSPMPDYSEYFDRADRLEYYKNEPRRAVDLPFEGARGCWWGQKQHCVFCGLNSSNIRFRSKSPERILREMSHLSNTYRSFHLESVDNIIDMSYFQKVLPQIEEMDLSWNIFYEVKSNLKPEQVETLARAGVRRIQPGIESLSSDILKLMRKGVTAMQNISLLRWCAHFGVSVSWNFLWGIPGERKEHYQGQMQLMRRLRHFQPPSGEGRLWLERFSPMFTNQKDFGISKVIPEVSYGYVYPESVDLGQSAYFFDYNLDQAIPDKFFDPFKEELNLWRGAHEAGPKPTLKALVGPDFLRIEDGRGIGSNGIYELDGLMGKVYHALMEKPTTAKKVAIESGETEEQVLEAMKAFEERGLVFREGDSFLALAVPERATS